MSDSDIIFVSEEAKKLFWESLENARLADEEEENKIKPCPFCGGEGRVTDGGHSGRNFYIHCRNEHCIAYGGITKAFREEAIAIWNKRKP
jgi:hypothetical protein